MSKKPLSQVITRQTLKLLAGGRSFSRGEEYFRDRLVASLAIDGDRATAQVHGSRTYKCQLKTSGESLQGHCTCPAFDDDCFCKHLVAVGLAIIEAPKSREPIELDIRDEVRPPHERNRRNSQRLRHEAVSIQEIRDYLSNVSREKLIETLINQAMNDTVLLRSLRLEILNNRTNEIETERHKNPKKLIESIKVAIDQGVEIECNHDEWPDEYETAPPLQELTKKIKRLLKDGMAAEIVELTEYFIAAVEPIIERFHEGHLLYELLEELQSIHLKACKIAKPDPEALARRLFRWELSSGWGVFENSVSHYQSILGKTGIATYSNLAKVEWDKLPPKRQRTYYGDNFDRHRITRIMENIAKLSGDIESEVKVLQKNLSSGWNYLNIAKLYASHKIQDKAIEWAENGLKAFPDRPDGRLREFLAKEYHRLKRHDEAMLLIWEEFIDHPSLERLKQLKENADVIEDWSAWRKKAIDHIQSTIQKVKSARQSSSSSMSYSWNHSCSNSLLVEIYLWEKDIDSAWKQAKTGGTTSQLWYVLAQKREKDHPGDAAHAYQSIVEEEIIGGGNESYRAAIKLLTKIQSLLKEEKRDLEFLSYLKRVRTQFKPKRNFIRLLDAKFGDLLD